jgi:hypothetical protein
VKTCHRCPSVLRSSRGPTSNGPESGAKPFSFLYKPGPRDYHPALDEHDAWRQRVRRDQQLIERLRLAAFRLDAAQEERTWAIVAAHQQGLPIRRIAAATGLSATRVHQLLAAGASAGIPAWLSRLREPSAPAGPADEGTPPERDAALRAHLAEEVAALRRCLGWLERESRGEPVVVNLRQDGDVETEFVAFDRPRILRVLARIAADLDALASAHEVAAAGAPPGEEDPRARHRRRLAEPTPAPPRLSPREERARLRAELGLPPQ